jgi:hypothetical protein
MSFYRGTTENSVENHGLAWKTGLRSAMLNSELNMSKGREQRLEPKSINTYFSTTNARRIVGIEPLAELEMLFRGEVGKHGIGTALTAEFEGLIWISIHIFEVQYREGGRT